MALCHRLFICQTLNLLNIIIEGDFFVILSIYLQSNFTHPWSFIPVKTLLGRSQWSLCRHDCNYIADQLVVVFIGPFILTKHAQMSTCRIGILWLEKEEDNTSSYPLLSTQCLFIGLFRLILPHLHGTIHLYDLQLL